MFGKGFRRNRTAGAWKWEPNRFPLVDRSPAQIRAATARRMPLTRPPVEDRVERLDRTVAALDPYLREPAVSASTLVNPLLVVWDAAHDVVPDVATPVERLLTGLVHCTTVPATDVLEAVDDARARALQVLVLTGRVMVG